MFPVLCSGTAVWTESLAGSTPWTKPMKGSVIEMSGTETRSSWYDRLLGWWCGVQAILEGWKEAEPFPGMLEGKRATTTTTMITTE